MSDYVHQTILLAAEIERHDIPEREWERRYPESEEGALYGKELAISIVGERVGWLAYLGALRFGVVRETDRWRAIIDIGLVPTFGAVAMQTLLMVCRANSLYTCSGCGVPYIRAFTHHRMPKPDQNNYCPECADRSRPIYDAKKRYRAKQREAVRLCKEGKTINEVARILNTTPERVRNWTQKGQSDAENKKTR